MDANGTSVTPTSPEKEIPAGELKLNKESSHKGVLQFFSKEHSSEAFELIQQMRRDGKLCDVVLEVEGKTLPAHRLVLASSSHYFYSMFVGDMRESRQDLVHLKDVEYSAMKLLVEFAYTSRLEITVPNVQSLLTAASLFDFPTVREACGKFLIGQLHPSNCLGIRSFARTHGCEQLMEKASNYFRGHFIDAVKSEEFISIAGDELASLIDSDDVNVRSEEDVFRAVLTWLNHDTESRKEHLPALLRAVRLPLLSPSFLTSEVETNLCIKKSLECRDLLDEAKNFHLMPEQYWHNARTCFQPRKSTVGVLFAIGGRGAVGEPFNSVECFDFLTNTWYEGPELRSRRRHVGVACLGEKLYAVGGHDGNQHLNSVECYDPKVGKWDYVQPMKTLRRGIAVGGLGGPMYAVGTCLCVGVGVCWCVCVCVGSCVPACGCVYSIPNTCVVCEKVTGTSRFRKLFIHTHYTHTYTYSTRTHTHTTYIHAYYTPTHTLHTYAHYTTIHTLHIHTHTLHTHTRTYYTQTIHTHTHILYTYTHICTLHTFTHYTHTWMLSGGLDDVNCYRTVERYDPESNEWVEISPLRTSRGGVGVATLGGYLYACGGNDGSTSLQTMERYDPHTNKWTEVTPMSKRRAGVGLAALSGYLYAVGGFDDASPLDSVERCVGEGWWSGVFFKI